MNDDRGAQGRELHRPHGVWGAARAGAHRRTPGPASGDGHDGAWQSRQDRDSPGARRPKARSWWVELPVLLLLALLLALLIKSFVVQAFFIPSSSMENTLDIGDKVLVNKLVYDVRSIHRGDIIVFNGAGSWNPGPVKPPPPLTRLWDSVSGLFGTAPGAHDYIKRVIGIPGDHVACCDAHGRVTVNGVSLTEGSYLFAGNSPSSASFHATVPSGQLWVMGDHRSVSYDSRDHRGDPGGGAIPEDKVVGRAFTIVWPASRWRVLPIPATFEQPKLSAGLAGPAAGSAAAGSALAGKEPARAAAALSAGAPVRPAAPLEPLALSFGIAIPLTWLQRRLRRPLGRRVRGTWLSGRAWAKRLAARGRGPAPPGRR